MFTSDIAYSVYVQPWEYHSRWRNTQNDGCSIHRTKEDAKAFCEKYIAVNHRNILPALDEYALPSGDGYWGSVGLGVNMELDRRYNEGSNGLWIGESVMSDLLFKN